MHTGDLKYRDNYKLRLNHNGMCLLQSKAIRASTIKLARWSVRKQGGLLNINEGCEYPEAGINISV